MGARGVRHEARREDTSFKTRMQGGWRKGNRRGAEARNAWRMRQGGGGGGGTGVDGEVGEVGEEGDHVVGSWSFDLFRLEWVIRARDGSDGAAFAGETYTGRWWHWFEDRGGAFA